MSSFDPTPRRTRERATLAVLLGTAERVDAARNELLLSLGGDDPERLGAVTASQLTVISNAALALDLAIDAAFRSASPERAERLVSMAELASSEIDDRLGDVLHERQGAWREGDATGAVEPAAPVSIQGTSWRARELVQRVVGRVRLRCPRSAAGR